MVPPWWRFAFGSKEATYNTRYMWNKEKKV